MGEQKGKRKHGIHSNNPHKNSNTNGMWVLWDRWTLILCELNSFPVEDHCCIRAHRMVLLLS